MGIRRLDVLVVIATAGALIPLARAQTPSTPDTCRDGYVWREAFPDDRVCVTSEVRAQAAQDNSQAAARREPTGGAWGPNTCRPGFVWREAQPGDVVCVTPETRAQTAADNRAAASRRATPPPATTPSSTAGAAVQGTSTSGQGSAARSPAGGGLGPAREVPLPTENPRCQAYAHRAVDQYKLTTRSAKCRVRADGRWHSRHRGHYGWCLAVAPEAAKSEEAARDQHLYRCGAQARID